MKTKHSFFHLPALALVLLTGGSFPLARSAAQTASVWTCSMHPQIQQPEPSDCPICGMDLIPLQNDGADDAGPRELSMSESSKALADIQTSPVLREWPTYEIRLVGQLKRDETKVKSLTARFPARIESLRVDAVGASVEPGQTLATVYSPELLSAQRELLAAHQRDPESRLTQAARHKLLLWDLPAEQIDALLASGQAQEQLALPSPVGGIVVAKQVNEGDYLKTGQSLYTIADLSQLWLYLDAYESDLAGLAVGQPVQFSVKAYPGEIFRGSIAFIEPEINPKTRTVPVRVVVPNPDQRLKPGMFATARAEAVLGSEGEPPLLVPASAVLRTGKRAVVYIEKPNTERPTYEGREIVLGARVGDFFVVVEGLAAGDRVVTDGAFKIDSALQIQAKPSMMNPTEEIAVDLTAADETGITTQQTMRLIEPYLALQSALASDDLATAQAQAKVMMQITGHTGVLADALHAILAADSLDGVRKPHFETISNALIFAVKAQPEAFDGTLYIMHCPMVYGDHGADWLQASDALKNPYFGARMLRCGEVKDHLQSQHGKERTHE